MPNKVKSNQEIKPRWRGKSFSSDPLYDNSLNIDPTTGAPRDYISCFAAYDKAAREIALKQKIPLQDIPDAIQEINLKFFLKDGLSWYDSEKEFEMPDGSKRTARFFSMYQAWLFRSMLAQRDRVRKQGYRYTPIPEELFQDSIVPDIAVEISEENAATTWINKAKELLNNSGQENLIPVLLACANAANLNRPVTKTQLAQDIGCSPRTATLRLNKLRETLTSAGMGMETLQC